MLELRRGFGAGMVTALARHEGRPLGVVANDPRHLGGAIDADAADKAARFIGMCDAFGLPLLFLCDTPGFMVGPDAERTATVRHFARMFLGGANLRVPCGTIVLRKGYGLGAQAMAGGGFKAPLFTVGWPTSEFGGDGPGGRRAPGHAPRARRDRGRAGARAAVRDVRRDRLRARARPEHGRLRRDRRRDRPGRLGALDLDAVRRARRAVVEAARARRARTSTPGERPRPFATPLDGGIIGSSRHRASPGWTRADNRTDIFSRAGIRKELDRNR